MKKTKISVWTRRKIVDGRWTKWALVGTYCEHGAQRTAAIFQERLPEREFELREWK